MKFIKFLFLTIPFVSFGQVPGCVPIRGDYLYMRTTEVTNQHYTDFLKNISGEDSIKYRPDSEIWAKSMKYGEPMKEYYFRHPAYQNYPVVNITYEKAKAYCEWLTERLNHFNPSQKVLARLPTEKEWEYAARAGNDFAIYPWGTESMRMEKGKFQGQLRANFVLRKGITMADNADITAPVTAYWPNNFGLYNMSGNVSELVAEKGLVKGGSWSNRADYLRIDKQQFVYGASPEVGFRYVVEIIKLPPPNKKSKPIKLDKKFFKRYFANINDTLSIGKFEVSNELFDFMIPLGKSCLIRPNYPDTNWKNLFPYSQVWMTNYSSHPDYKNHPVVNVNQQVAKEFCLWLQGLYFQNYSEKVEIRLPTKHEWELAARGGKKTSPYPWGGPFIRNSKGNYLANFNPKMSEDENVNGYDTLSLNNFFQMYFNDLHDYDGEAVIAPVDAYFPNNYGLYNMAGNVAEMVLDSNFTKGGSWKSKSYYLQIESQEEWDKQANPFTGFRVVMIRRKS